MAVLDHQRGEETGAALQLALPPAVVDTIVTDGAQHADYLVLDERQLLGTRSLVVVQRPTVVGTCKPEIDRW